MCFEAAKLRMARLEHLGALGVLAFYERQPDFFHPGSLDPKFPGFGLCLVQAACTLHLQICLLVCDPTSCLLLLPFSLSVCQQAGNYWSRRDRQRCHISGNSGQSKQARSLGVREHVPP